jgi:hypothetical protein
MSRKSLSGLSLRAPYLDVQRKFGAADVYSGQFSASYIPIQDNTGGGAQYMRLTYTPPVDAWWELHGYIGLVVCDSAAYVHAYGTIQLTPADADGYSNAYGTAMQHSQVDTYIPRVINTIYRLNAGVTYTADLGFSISSGAWRYYCGKDYLHLFGKAWAR